MRRLDRVRPAPASPTLTTNALDPESEAWVADLASAGARHQRAVADLHDRLLRAARREGERRRGSVPPRVVADLDDLARQAADDAVVAVLRKLPTFRGQSRFTTWAFKFALFEMSTALRRESWRGRSISLDDGDWQQLEDRNPIDPEAASAIRELVETVRSAVDESLTVRQREVFMAVVVDGIPIGVVADRTGRTRNATYKMLHDARATLRTHLKAGGWQPATEGTGP